MRDITLCHPRLQTLAAELIKKCAMQGLQIKIGETLVPLQSRMPCTHRGVRSRVRSSRMPRVAAIAAIISGAQPLIFTGLMGMVRIMIKMDFSRKSGRSE
ncbi:MAG: hypothetical protein V8S93_01685 [Lachnospiraceae bacterium]